MERIVLKLHLMLMVSILSSVTGWAQATAQLGGTVRDQSGAVLPGVEVTKGPCGCLRTVVDMKQRNRRWGWGLAR